MDSEKSWFTSEPETMTSRHSNLLILFLFSLILSAALNSVYFDKQLSADGVYYFVGVLEWQTFTTFDWTRRFANYFIQGPLLMAVSAGVNDIPDLRRIFGLGLLLPWVAAFALSLFANRREDKSALLFMMISLICVNLASDYILAGEHQVMAVLSWPILFFLLRRPPLTWLDGGLLCGLLICYARLYPTALLPAALFMALAVSNFSHCSARKERIIYMASAALSLGVLAISAFAILSPWSSVDRQSFATTLMLVMLRPEALTQASFALLFFIGWYLNKQVISWLALLPLVLFAIYALATNFALSAQESFENRSLTTFFLPLFLLAAVLIKRKNLHINLVVAITILTFSTLMVASNLSNTRKWTEYVSQYKSTLLQRDGLVPIESTELPHSPYVWVWNNPLLSIVWSNGCVGSVIQNAQGLPWEPEGPPHRFWLTEYNCYTKEFHEINSDVCLCQR